MKTALFVGVSMSEPHTSGFNAAVNVVIVGASLSEPHTNGMRYICCAHALYARVPGVLYV